MRFLHTADWHLGQQFHQFDRTNEHRAFLDWLFEQLKVLEIDVLLVSGDLYDHAHPASATQKMLYGFLARVGRECPQLHVIVTAGNHDSAHRLESPEPFLDGSRIHLVGTVKKDAEGNILYDRLTIPLKDAEGNIRAWCMAVPFLRPGDCPPAAETEKKESIADQYAAAVARFYADHCRYAENLRRSDQPIVAMGHLHAQGAAVGSEDENERTIMGGLESISAAAFPESIAYIALGHIHKAQDLGGRSHVRYSGSPLPLSFSELNYRHGVTFFEIRDHRPVNLAHIEAPVTVPLLRLPDKPQPLDVVLETLRQQLPAAEADRDQAPFLSVQVLLDGPQTSLRNDIEKALADKHARLVKIETVKAQSSKEPQKKTYTVEQLRKMSPLEMYEQMYFSKYNNPLPDNLKQLFQEVVQQINLTPQDQ